MKTLPIVIILFVSLLVSMGLSKPSAYAENENPPVIITQVELGSQLVLLSDNQTCTSPPDPRLINNCLTDLVSGHKVQCSYFLGPSTCEPLHHWTSGTNHSCLEGYPQAGAPQWFDIYNTLGAIVDLQNFTAFDKFNYRPYAVNGPFPTILELKPYEKCTFPWLPLDEALSMGLNNMSMAISYNYDGKHYEVSTPSLSDVYNDTRTWQFDGNKWTFAEQNTVTVPEFPSSTNILPAGFQGFVMSRDTYRPGDSVPIVGSLNPESVIKIILKNPHGKIIETNQSFSDNNGLFSLIDLRIPEDAIFGVWNVDVTDGIADYVKPLTIEFPLPLKQFKSGVNATNTNCDPSLELVIKSEDGSPACVEPHTVKVLVSRGWAKELVTLESNLNSNKIIGVVAIQMIPPYTPGGPTIQITLKNMGMKPITSIEAVLELYNNYTFDFKDVTGSTPLHPGNSTTDTKTLIGGGFQSEFPYLLMISGISNDLPFNYTESVHIPYTDENNPVQEHSSIISSTQSKGITIFENNTGIVTLGNQTYYFDTPNYTDTVYTNPIQVSFHDVLFTLFPSRFAGGLPANGCGGKYYWANAEFPDGASELLQVFVDSQSCSMHTTPIDLSVHTIPQAGLTFYDGKMKLLVSVETQVGKNIMLQKPSYDVRPFPICNTNPTKEKLVREKQKILTDVLLAEEAKHGGFENRTQNLPWSGIGYDCVDNALEVNILPQYFSADLLPKYFEKIRSIVGNLIDITLSPEGYATPV